MLLLDGSAACRDALVSVPILLHEVFAVVFQRAFLTIGILVFACIAESEILFDNIPCIGNIWIGRILLLQLILERLVALVKRLVNLIRDILTVAIFDSLVAPVRCFLYKIVLVETVLQIFLIADAGCLRASRRRPLAAPVIAIVFVVDVPLIRTVGICSGIGIVVDMRPDVWRICIFPRPRETVRLVDEQTLVIVPWIFRVVVFGDLDTRAPSPFSFV